MDFRECFRNMKWCSVWLFSQILFPDKLTKSNLFKYSLFDSWSCSLDFVFLLKMLSTQLTRSHLPMTDLLFGAAVRRTSTLGIATAEICKSIPGGYSPDIRRIVGKWLKFFPITFIRRNPTGLVNKFRSLQKAYTNAGGSRVSKISIFLKFS